MKVNKSSYRKSTLEKVFKVHLSFIDNINTTNIDKKSWKILIQLNR